MSKLWQEITVDQLIRPHIYWLTILNVGLMQLLMLNSSATILSHARSPHIYSNILTRTNATQGCMGSSGNSRAIMSPKDSENATTIYSATRTRTNPIVDWERQPTITMERILLPAITCESCNSWYDYWFSCWGVCMDWHLVITCKTINRMNFNNYNLWFMILHFFVWTSS